MPGSAGTWNRTFRLLSEQTPRSKSSTSSTLYLPASPPSASACTLHGPSAETYRQRNWHSRTKPYYIYIASLKLCKDDLSLCQGPFAQARASHLLNTITGRIAICWAISWCWNLTRMRQRSRSWARGYDGPSCKFFSQYIERFAGSLPEKHGSITTKRLIFRLASFRWSRKPSTYRFHCS